LNHWQSFATKFVSGLIKKEMKNILLTLLALGFFACRYYSQVEAQLEVNTFLVQKNAIKWNGVTDIRYNNGIDTLVILCSSRVPNDESVVGMKIKFEGEDIYPLKTDQALYYTTVGKDVITSRYKPSPNAVGQVVNIKYDKAKKLIEGSFELLLEKEWSSSENDTDSITLTKGYFKGEIKN
jgi:hypothetical protein